MRFYRKKQCFETIGLLDEAHGELVRFIEKKHIDDAVSLLEQCQQGAISVGMLIDESEGEGRYEVNCLEEYCELIYQIHENLLGGIPVNTKQLRKKLRKPLGRVKSGLNNNIDTQREVVFLPYKASMWDSLESVWEAANAEPGCKAVVIPIPYYDKESDGALGKMHYEIEQFPPSVPVVKYDDYNFEKKHPDMIFFHNPYDNGNYVTSVHPFFYSKNLRQYTEKLIYIPYFILENICISNKQAIADMEHFCTASGVVNADYVIVQSEAMREIYINVLMKYFGENRSYWEKKILGLGSPKVDKVCNLKMEDFELPEEWKKLLQKKDGRRKKTIFYNTTVSALLKHGEEMLEKIRRTLQIFKENSDNTILIWRPHPLTESTIVAMRPHLLKEYQDIVLEFKEAGWGIYDDSPNLDRAIAVSDAYYGDCSSVVWLYQQTGKPIMIQNIKI